MSTDYSSRLSWERSDIPDFLPESPELETSVTKSVETIFQHGLEVESRSLENRRFNSKPLTAEAIAVEKLWISAGPHLDKAAALSSPESGHGWEQQLNTGSVLADVKTKQGLQLTPDGRTALCQDGTDPMHTECGDQIALLQFEQALYITVCDGTGSSAENGALMSKLWSVGVNRLIAENPALLKDSKKFEEALSKLARMEPEMIKYMGLGSFKQLEDGSYRITELNGKSQTIDFKSRKIGAATVTHVAAWREGNGFKVAARSVGDGHAALITPKGKLTLLNPDKRAEELRKDRRDPGGVIDQMGLQLKQSESVGGGDFHAREGDYLLVGSDGLWDNLSEEEIVDAMRTNREGRQEELSAVPNAQKMARVNAALKRKTEAAVEAIKESRPLIQALEELGKRRVQIKTDYNNDRIGKEEKEAKLATLLKEESVLVEKLWELEQQMRGAKPDDNGMVLHELKMP